jgi:hypothetical protein
VYLFLLLVFKLKGTARMKTPLSRPRLFLAWFGLGAAFSLFSLDGSLNGHKGRKAELIDLKT